jgi:hypothetical protein
VIAPLVPAVPFHVNAYGVVGPEVVDAAWYAAAGADTVDGGGAYRHLDRDEMVRRERLFQPRG